MIKGRNIMIILIAIMACGFVFAAEQDSKETVSPAKLAFKLRMEGKINEAQKLLKDAIDKDPKDDLAYYELARLNFSNIYITMNDESKEVKERQELLKHNLLDADKAIVKAIKLNDNDPRYHYFQGVVKIYISVYDFHNVLTMPSAAFSMGQMYESIETALELKPDYHKARLMILGIYDRNPFYLGGNKFKARKYVKQLQQMDSVYGLKGICELRENDKLDKVALWKELVSKEPENSAARQGLAMELLEAGQLNQAAAELEKAIELDPETKMLTLDFATKLITRKEYKSAEKYLESFLEYEKAPLIFRATAMRKLANLKDKYGQSETVNQLHEKTDLISKADYKYLEMKSLDLLTEP